MLHNYDNYSLLSSAELTVILEITAHLVVVVCFFFFFHFFSLYAQHSIGYPENAIIFEQICLVK